MVSLFGVPLFGTLFVPLVVGLGSFFVFWKFFFSSKSFSSPVPSNNELQKSNAYIESQQLTEKGAVHSNRTKEKPKERKKGCGGKGKGGCCSSKKGQTGTCSSTNKAISRAKIFADVNSKICKVKSPDIKVITGLHFKVSFYNLILSCRLMYPVCHLS